MQTKRKRYLLTSPNAYALPGTQVPNAEDTQFKVGKFYPGRAKTFAKEGNYYGYPSKEAWAASYKARQKLKADKVKSDKRHHDIVRESRTLQDLARDMCPKVIRTMGDILDNPNSTDIAKIQASNLIWDRAYGKPTQTTVNANVNADAKPTEVDGQELDRRISSALERIERLTKREAKEGQSEEPSADLRKYH